MTRPISRRTFGFERRWPCRWHHARRPCPRAGQDEGEIHPRCRFLGAAVELPLRRGKGLLFGRRPRRAGRRRRRLRSSGHARRTRHLRHRLRRFRHAGTLHGDQPCHGRDVVLRAVGSSPARDRLQEGCVREPEGHRRQDAGGTRARCRPPDVPRFSRASPAIDMSKVTLRHIDFPLRETLVVRGEAQGATGFVSSVALNMVRAGVPLDQIGWISYASVGIDLFGSTIFAKKEFLEKSPEIARGFAKATARSMQAMMARSARVDRGRRPAASRSNTMEVELPRYQMVLEQSIATPTTRANGIGHVDQARLTKNHCAVVRHVQHSGRSGQRSRLHQRVPAVGRPAPTARRRLAVHSLGLRRRFDARQERRAGEVGEGLG